MQIGKHSVVSIDYTLTNSSGEVLDSSQGQEPLAYIHGIGFMIPGLEKALEGKIMGDALSVTAVPEDAYGEHDEELVKVVDRTMFGDTEALEAGMQFQNESEDGVEVVTITAIEGDKVTVNGNHPLAGVTLNFDVQIVDVRKASQEELDHGHVHGAGGHHH